MKLIGRHAVLMILSRLAKLVSLCRLRAGRVGRQTVIEKIFSFMPHCVSVAFTDDANFKL